MAIALVTGGAGFIGRELCLQLVTSGHHVVVIDKGTYAARFDLLASLQHRSDGRALRVIQQDVVDLDHLYGADVVFHLAAESHVDNSIDDAAKFIQTNVGGTYHLLERIRGLRAHDRPVLIHVSTDEVYGDRATDSDWASNEWDALEPSSPYAASKAAADMLVLAWQRTYGLRARIVRPSNCYGVDQYPEKLIPKTIRRTRLGQPMTIHGDGSQTRSWLAVEDCARALLTVWQRGGDGETYNVPGNAEVSVRSVVTRIQHTCREILPHCYTDTLPGCERPGGDRAYRVAGERLRDLGWEPRGAFLRDIDRIVRAELESPILI